MTEADIKGHALAIQGAMERVKEIEARAAKAKSMADISAIKNEADQFKEVMLTSAIALGVGLLVDINRIAAALEFVASQHNNSEALFKG